jgi:hypothetical protein
MAPAAPTYLLGGRYSLRGCVALCTKLSAARRYQNDAALQIS